MFRRDGSRSVPAWTWSGVVLAASCSMIAVRAAADEFAPAAKTLDVAAAAADDVPPVIPVRSQRPTRPRRKRPPRSQRHRANPGQSLALR